jgi:hypothetical protein
MEYHLYPHFFVIEPQTSFSKAWEDFCCRLLNLEYKTTAIHRRTPPDRGIDLFWQAEGIAYQCKAVESGQAGDFQTSHVKTSLKSAQKYQAQTGWRKYVLCTNVDLTGPQKETLQQMFPDMEILLCGYWTELCRHFHEQVADRFRLAIPVAPVYVQRAIQTINQVYLRTYLPQMQEYSQVPFINILLYSDKYKHIFEFSIPSTFTAHEVLLMLRELFELPGPKYMQEYNTTVSLEYSLHVDNKEVAPQQKLSELQINDRPLVTLWKTIVWSDSGRKTQTTDLESPFKKPILKPQTPIYGPERLAVEQYKQEIDRAIDQAISQFNQG